MSGARGGARIGKLFRGPAIWSKMAPGSKQRRGAGVADRAVTMNDRKPGVWDEQVSLAAPLLRRLHGLWLDRCRGERLPARRDFDPIDMRDCLGAVFLVEAVPFLDDFRYTLIGSEIVREVGIDNTGRLVGEVFGAGGLALYRKVRDERRPIRVHGAVDWRRKDYKAYEAVLMPLADDGATVDRFIGAMVFAPAAA